MRLSDPAQIQHNYAQLAAAARESVARQAQRHSINIRVGTASCGIAAGAQETFAALGEAVAHRKINARISQVGCLGHCYAEPLVTIHHPQSGLPPLLYANIDADRARMLVRYFLEQGDPCLEHLLAALEPNEVVPSVMDFTRFNQEKRIVMRHCGTIDPERIDAYLALDGYGALAAALCRPADAVIETIEAAGLRGRGGAGYPTGRKWRMVREAPGRQKVVICNADEGDPGAYMDRALLESDPHQVLEGILLCAYAVGAGRALIYVRAEYPLAVKRLQTAIVQAAARGLVGRSILGSGFDLQVQVFQGSGAFVCGEETALIRSVEGFRGIPRPRPPYPASHGLDALPTVVNNVKTLAAVPPIMANGSDWFRSIGTRESPGTAIFSVVGSVNHPGLVEIPMGTRLRQLIFEVCGGIPNRKQFKAVQIGGPSGGCLPETLLDLPIDFDSLTAAGAMMGSGGMVVMDEDTCMVEVARFFLDFIQKESCGRCTFCRIGTYHLLQVLQRMTRGEGQPGDLDLLKDLGRDIQMGSLCGLGKTAVNPVLTSLKYFQAEYQAHLVEKRCPAGACRPLTAYYIDLDKCARGCDVCVGCCPVDAVFTTSTRKKGIDPELCVRCGECMSACPSQYDAVRKVSPPQRAPTVKRPESAQKGT